MKHEWRKAEKDIYLPKNKPALIQVPDFKYVTVKGEGNPNSDEFPEYIAALYAISYAIKMNYKKREKPEGYTDYSVYPLEGVWDINEDAKKNFTEQICKDDLVFKLMIRQPDFVSESYFSEMLALTLEKKPHPLLKELKFESIIEGSCVQMLHLGSYDNEPQSFELMEQFAVQNGFRRISKVHREIYLSDARKTAPEKLKTVLRFKVEKM